MALRFARIVNVSSLGPTPIDFTDVMMERSYNPGDAYRRSKLAQIMFTIDLAAELDAAAKANAQAYTKQRGPRCAPSVASLPVSLTTVSVRGTAIGAVRAIGRPIELLE